MIHRTQTVCAVLEETDVKSTKKIYCTKYYIGVVFVYLCIIQEYISFMWYTDNMPSRPQRRKCTGNEVKGAMTVNITIMRKQTLQKQQQSRNTQATRKLFKMKQFVGPTIKPGDADFPMHIFYHGSSSNSGGSGNNSSIDDDNDGGGSGCVV